MNTFLVQCDIGLMLADFTRCHIQHFLRQSSFSRPVQLWLELICDDQSRRESWDLLAYGVVCGDYHYVLVTDSVMNKCSSVLRHIQSALEGHRLSCYYFRTHINDNIAHSIHWDTGKFIGRLGYVLLTLDLDLGDLILSHDEVHLIFYYPVNMYRFHRQTF